MDMSQFHLNFSEYFKTLKFLTSSLPLNQAIETSTLQASLLTYLIWHGWHNYGRINKRQLLTLIQTSQKWHEGIVKSLTSLSKTLIDNKLDENLTNETSKLTHFALEAELNMLESTLSLMEKQKSNPRQRVKDSCHNICIYLKYQKASLNHEQTQQITRLLHTSYPQETETFIKQQLKNSLTQAKIKISQAQQLTLADLD